VEVYSRLPSSVFIQGIERYGHYRMYARQAHEADDMVNGNSRIEFVNGRNMIVHSINPRNAFTINGQEEMWWEEDNGELTRVSFNLSDCRRYVDTILYDSSRYSEWGSGCSFSGFIEYRFFNELVQLSLHAGIGSDEPTGLETYESVFYDTLGQEVLRLSESGPIGSVYLTTDRKYVYMSGGGALTEDFVAPYTFKIIELDSGKVLLERKSDDIKHDGFIISGTNLGVYEVQKEGGSSALLEAYIIDHDKNLIYLIHQNALCQPPFYVLYYKDYCECRKPNGLRTKLYYDKDFTAVTFIKQ
jgi:hypothetical protein